MLPFIQFSLSSPADVGLKAAAQHIRDAQRNPGSTQPPATHVKQIPGAYPNGLPLHRLYYPRGSLTKDSNGNAARAACTKHLGVQPTGTDCDEYPFKSTLEGAASGGDFSVRYIASAENRTAGSRLGAWYGSDRILDGDAFGVSIVD